MGKESLGPGMEGLGGCKEKRNSVGAKDGNGRPYMSVEGLGWVKGALGVCVKGLGWVLRGFVVIEGIRCLEMGMKALVR